MLLARTFALARAEDAAEPRARSNAAAQEIGLEYEVPAGCPGIDVYLTDVAQRLGPGWHAALKDLARHLTVTVTHVGERYTGSLDLVTRRGERFYRSVNGAVCSEVVLGIGLITELAAKARASEPAGAIGTSSDTGAAAAADADRDTDARAAPAPSPLSSTPQSESGVRPASALRAKRNTAVPPVQGRVYGKAKIRFGARASLTSGVGPSVAMGPGVFAVLELDRARFGLSADLHTSGEVQARRVRADFRLLSVRLDGCPWSFRLGDWGAAEPCAAAELGSFRAAPEIEPPIVTAAAPQSIAWGAVGLLGRFVLRFRPFVAQVELIGRAPLRRESFFVGSREDVVFRIPVVSAGASAGLGLEF
ncbi:MAG TPA: hypothetical protein VFQ61_22390 [Polyangiaceae bacterium]|nr:hypothetical protein [Polyangiaceae bacterium]